VDYPDSILAYLLDRLHPVYFLIDDQGTILSWGGALDDYRIPAPQKGMRIGDLLFFVEGLLPMPDNHLVLECVEWRDGIVVDVHLFRDAGRLWLLLTDAGPKAQYQRRVQQQANAMQLLGDAHPPTPAAHMFKDATRGLLDIDVRQGAQRRTLSILFASIRRFTWFCEHASPADGFDTLNAYLAAIIEPVLEYSGIVDKIVGGGVMAVFGLLPSDGASAALAVAAAKAVIEKTRGEAENRRQTGNLPLTVGIGIATGPVVWGMIGSQHRKTMSVTGRPVNLAAHLAHQAAGQELLIDRTTWQVLPANGLAFTARRLTPRGMDRPITAYSWTMMHEN
jgi:class 3 adenylate cyclase